MRGIFLTLSLRPKKNFFSDHFLKQQIESPPIQFCESIGNDRIRIPCGYDTFLRKQKRWPLNCNAQPIGSDGKFIGQLYPNQQEIITEAEQYLSTMGSITLNVATGLGKTAMSIYLSIRLGLRTLICIPSQAGVLIKQWKKQYLKFTTGITSWIVGDENEPEHPPDIIICMDTRVHKIPTSWIPTIGTLILDEGHLLCTPSSVKLLLCSTPSYIIVNTATLHRDDGMIAMIQLLAGVHKIVRYSTKETQVYLIHTGITFCPQLQRNGNTDTTHMERMICQSKVRNQLIVDLVIRNISTYKILILVRLKDHAVTLMNMLSEKNIVSSKLTGDDKTATNARVCIGTKKIGTGFDEESFFDDYVEGERFNLLILATPLKSLVSLEQYIGRVLRSETPVIFDLIDLCSPNKTLKNRLTERMKWYRNKERKIKINEISLNLKVVEK
jgi:superfamily II DNA or RNA helicase